MAEPVTTVVGGSVAAMVAVDALAATGREVHWLRPRRGVGGGFNPLVVGDRRLDLGMRVLELDYDAPAPEPSPPLEAYQPGPHGHRPFLDRVQDLVDGLVGPSIVDAGSMATWVRGAIGADYVVTGDLGDLSRLVQPADLARIRAEAAVAVSTEGSRGMFQPDRQPELWLRSYDHGMRSHAGDTFTDRLVAPLADGILPGGGADVVAALHRKIWLPLFHPATVHEAATGALSYRPCRPALTVSGRGMGGLVGALDARASAHPLVRTTPVDRLQALSPGIDGLRLEFAGGLTCEARCPILGLDPVELFGAVGVAYEPERTTTAIAWVDVHRPSEVPWGPTPPAVLWVIDADVRAYRLSRNLAEPATSQRSSWIVELHHDVPAEELAVEAVRALRRVGLAGPGADVVHAARFPSFVTPSATNLERFDAAAATWAALEVGAEVVGGAVGFGVDSFNEQVVQGLRAAARLRTATG